MMPTVACLGPTALFAAVGGAGALLVVAVFGAKSLLGKAVGPALPTGKSAVLTTLEPLVYFAGTAGLTAIGQFGWGWENIQILEALPVIGFSTAFVVLAGIHGGLLGLARPGIGETKRLALAVLHASFFPVFLSISIGVAYLGSNIIAPI